MARSMQRKMKTKYNNGRKLLFSTLLLVLLAPLHASLAHQQKSSVTQVLFNSNSGNIEVMHRFYLHDAEHAAMLIFGTQPSLIESKETRDLFASYVMGRFAMQTKGADGDSRELPLSYVGEEVDGQFLWIYQEVPDTENITDLTIVNLTLRDVWPDQSNLVNIEREGKIQSLTFSGSAEILSVDLL